MSNDDNLQMNPDFAVKVINNMEFNMVLKKLVEMDYWENSELRYKFKEKKPNAYLNIEDGEIYCDSMEFFSSYDCTRIYKYVNAYEFTGTNKPNIKELNEYYHAFI